MDTLLGLGISLLLFAFFSGTEVAFTSMDKVRFGVGKKSRLSDRILSYFLRHPGSFISTMLVGGVVVLVWYGILSAVYVASFLPPGVLANPLFLWLTQILVAAALILLVGEFLPRSLSKINPNAWLRVLSLPLLLFHWLLWPVAWLLSLLSRLLLRTFGVRINKAERDKAFSKVDLDNFVQKILENVEDEDKLDAEVRIFQNALDFSNVKIRDCIVPRTEVVAVEVTDTLEELRNLFVESGLSKIIVYEDTIDNVIGYIHSSEMFRNPADWQNCVKPIPIVPETMPAHKLMKLFMQQKKTIAVVVDEFGGMTGIVTLEDLVEEIFGDIEDEHDNVSYICKQVGDREYVLSARLEIEKVNEDLGLSLPESDDYMTVGGLILSRYQNFPKLHEVVTIDRYQFKILRVTATKIELVRLKVVE
ncbi:MAG TPA: hemolysin family protein [Candidatus Bacteroides merdigallinarum]|uniref:Hemolysin family protein n=1 Tax=Candidatus Bacteroides merdigallinarum TaxID=2838473 RepID=A0A9D2EA59_9BACE|nr:hemolysin family protein [Candidatus Bacteroides merdigallinarum]